jgi:hypothetical protein
MKRDVCVCVCVLSFLKKEQKKNSFCFHINVRIVRFFIYLIRYGCPY